MKLLNCLKCHDIVALQLTVRSCICGASLGKYCEKGIIGHIKGPARVIGIANPAYKRSLEFPVMPFITQYLWFPIISSKEHNVIVDESLEMKKNN